ncbi:aminoglycoside phosphotransferase family protein [Cupidesulfovibrio sp. SRB-5]|nr:aminoglycoside phosphotransferase family protein [Nitratidesulfovibrio sp. SRB-5]
MVAEFLGRMILQREGDGAGALSGALSGAMPDPASCATFGSTPGFPQAVPGEADAATPQAWAAALGVPVAGKGAGAASAPGTAPVSAEDVSFLAAGEYHENWLVRSPAGPVVLRGNRGGAAGSQLGLADQISYEYRVLHALAGCAATPRPLALAPAAKLPDGDPADVPSSPAEFPSSPASGPDTPTPTGGALLMQWLPGRPLDYRADARHAARVFAAVHAAPVPPAVELPPPGPVPHVLPRGVLAAQPDPLAAIVAESSALLARHADHPLAPRMATARQALLDYRDRVARLAGDTRHLFADEAPVIANTEVNSGNFLVPEGDAAAFPAPCGAWLVDWEKAVVTTRYQDLGHFLAPTTTLWKTDFTFDAATRAAFLDHYRAALRHAGQPVPDAEECAAKADVMVRAVLLRGLSWCLMAWHEYAGGGRALAHADTFRTIERYLGNIAWFLR